MNNQEFELAPPEGSEDLTGLAEPSADIWPYVQDLTAQEIVSINTLQNKVIEKLYRDENRGHEYVVLPLEELNYHVVLVIDIARRIVSTHYLLDMSDPEKLIKKEQ